MMELKKISVIDAISFAFKAILDHIRLFFFVFIAGTGLIALVVSIIGFFNMSIISSFADTSIFQSIQDCSGPRCFTIIYQSGRPMINFIFNHALSLVISSLILSFFFVGLDLGCKAIALNIYDTNNAEVKTLWSYFNLTLTGLCAWALYCVMMWIGFFFFIIPGLIVLLRFGFFPFFIIDKKSGVIESLKQSYHATHNHIWEILAFWIVIKIIMYAGGVTYIGILLTWPLSVLAYTYIYRQLIPAA